jgi:hypothetical protein
LAAWKLSYLTLRRRECERIENGPQTVISKECINH